MIVLICVIGYLIIGYVVSLFSAWLVGRHRQRGSFGPYNPSLALVTCSFPLWPVVLIGSFGYEIVRRLQQRHFNPWSRMYDIGVKTGAKS